MLRLRSIVLIALLWTTACSAADIEVGGGRVETLDDSGDARDAGARDASADRWHSSEGREGDGDRDRGAEGSSGRDDGAADDGVADSPDNSNEVHAGDAGGRVNDGCDLDGPYCTPDGGVFADACAARRAGEDDARLCPWVDS